MALVTRTLSNVGSPLVSPNGTPLANVKIDFVLTPVATTGGDVFDALTGERVTGTTSALTNAAGEFTVQLWPNDRGAIATQYLCRVANPTVKDFKASVPSGPTTLSWVAFMAQGTVLTPAQIAELEHVANKDASNGYAGLTLFKLNFMNALGTFKSFFTNSNTAARTYTFQDRDGTIADNTDIATREAIANKGATNGYAPLDAAAKVPLVNMPGLLTRLIGKEILSQNVYRISFQQNQISDGINTCGNYLIGFKAKRGFAHPRFVFSNTNTPLVGAETPNVNDITVRFAVSLNGGIYPAYFGGARDIVIKPGGIVISDPVPIYCLAADLPYLRTCVSVASSGMKWPLSGSVVTSSESGVPNEGAVLSPTYQDLTTSGAIGYAYVYAFAPIAILAQSSSYIQVARLGDSIGYGQTANSYPYGELQGWQALLLNTLGIGNSNFNSPGEKASDYYVQSYAPSRRYLSRFASHTLCEYGINDITAGETLVQVQGYLQAIWDGEAAAGRKVAQTTITPLTSSIDGWTTTAGQNDFSAQTALLISQINTWIKTLPTPLAAYIDIRPAVEASPGANVWKPNFTGDGLHPNQAGHTAMATDAGVITQMQQFLSM